MQFAAAKRIKEFVCVLIAALLLTVVCPSAVLAATGVSDSAFVSEYICDFEGNYYAGLSTAVCTNAEIMKEDGNRFLNLIVNTNSDSNFFEIYNSSDGVFNLKDGHEYAVTISYKVKSVSAAGENDSKTMINLVRTDGISNKMNKIKIFPECSYSKNDTTEWITTTQVFTANLSGTESFTRLSVSVFSPTCSATVPTLVYFDNIHIVECNPSASGIALVPRGTVEPGAVMAMPGEPIELPTPTKPLCDFGGWYTDSACTSKFTSSTMPSESIQLYAKWTVSADAVEIKYVSNGGNEVESAIGRAGEAYEMPAPKRNYFVFAGWYDSRLKHETKLTEFPEKSVTLYAKWVAKPIRCSFENTNDYPTPNNGSFTKRCLISQDYAYSGNNSLRYDVNLGTSNYAKGGYARVVLLDENGNAIPLESGHTYTASFKYRISEIRKDTSGKEQNGTIGFFVSAKDSGWSAYNINMLPWQQAPGYSSADIGKGWLSASCSFTASFSNPAGNYLGIGFNGNSNLYVDEVIIYESDPVSKYEGSIVEFDTHDGIWRGICIGEIGHTITMPDNPVREGYRFLGWFEDAEGTVPFTGTKIDGGYRKVYGEWFIVPVTTEPEIQIEPVPEPVITEEPAVAEPKDSNFSLFLAIGIIAIVVIAAAAVTVILVKKKKSVHINEKIKDVNSESVAKDEKPEQDK